jgi:hypothetical protein
VVTAVAVAGVNVSEAGVVAVALAEEHNVEV